MFPAAPVGATFLAIRRYEIMDRSDPYPRKVRDMTRFDHFGPLCLAALLALATWAQEGRAQPAVASATAVRVIELVDPATGERAREVAADLTRAEIARVQRGLASAGFDPGRATGILTSTTAIALGRFQASRGLYRCDCVSYETLIALAIRPLVVATIVAPVPYGSGYGSDVVWIGSRRSHDGFAFGHGSAVVVGHSPSVFWGHDPARGAGQIQRPPARPSRPPVHAPRPSRPRPGISGSGAEIRALTPARPQPRTPFPGSATAP
jgi:hypothetical protein